MDITRESSRRSIGDKSAAPGESRRIEAALHEQPRRERHLLRCPRTGLDMERSPLAPVKALRRLSMPCSRFLRRDSVRSLQQNRRVLIGTPA